LLKSGAHFGHNTSRWNPKMKQYIFASRGDIHILDLEKTRTGLLKAAEFAKETASKGGIVLFVGTKKQTREMVKAAALACSMPYVNVRWLGGTFTNFKTIQKTIRKLEKLQETTSALDFNERYTKKERLQMTREIEKMTKLFEGVKDMRKLPDIVVVLDVNYDKIAVTEAKKSGVKVVGIADSNSNPDTIDYIIPANDDATKTIDLIASCLAEAVMDGKKRASVSTQA
jgi:small subunit ribosomal protein S2